MSDIDFDVQCSKQRPIKNITIEINSLSGQKDIYNITTSANSVIQMLKEFEKVDFDFYHVVHQFGVTSGIETVNGQGEGYWTYIDMRCTIQKRESRI